MKRVFFEKTVNPVPNKQLLWTFTGGKKKGGISFLGNWSHVQSEYLLLHSSFLGSRLHMFHKDNWDNGTDTTLLNPECKKLQLERCTFCNNW